MVLLFAILTIVPAVAKDKDNSKALFQKGQDAEVCQNYEAAYNYFKQAYELKPQEISYRLAYTRTRFLAAAVHVHRGQLLRDDGKLQDALAEFQTAKLIDSSQPIIDQEIRRTRALLDRLGQAPGQAPPDTDRTE
jgi:general secretion pathway protein D